MEIEKPSYRNCDQEEEQALGKRKKQLRTPEERDLKEKHRKEVVSKKKDIARRLQVVESNLGKALASKKSTLESAFHDKGFKTSSKIHDLRKQIEFYFGDPNLARDRWMRNLISQHEKGYVPVETLFSFNKINAIMFDSDFSSLKDKRRAMLEAIKKSELLKLNKSGDLVKRRIPFDASLPHNRQFRAEVDTRMIYIENLPTFTSHDLLAEILLKNDPEAAVLHISLPRFQTKQIKGFAFIELKVRPKQTLRANDLQTKEMARNALKLNGFLPEQLLAQDAEKSKLVPLRVMLKTEWLEWRHKFNELATTIKKSLKPASLQDIDPNHAHFLEPGSVLKFKLVDRLVDATCQVTKQDIRIAVMHVTDPAYVDLVPGATSGFVRFYTQKQKEFYLESLGDSRALVVKNRQLRFQEISSEEEKDYFQEVTKRKQRVRSQAQTRSQSARPNRSKN